MKKITYSFKITHKKLRKVEIWTTQNNDEILLQNMEDDHVINALALLMSKKSKLDEFKLPETSVNNKKLSNWINILGNELKYRNIIK